MNSNENQENIGDSSANQINPQKKPRVIMGETLFNLVNP